MKSLPALLIFILSILVYACGSDQKAAEPSESSSQKVDSTKQEETSKIENKLPDSEYGFWIINLSAAETEEQAIEAVTKLRETDPKYGYLWIPDYSTLSGKELFVVFKGPYLSNVECIQALVEYQKTDPKAYAVKAEKEGKTRKSIYGKFDIRWNKVKQNLVLIYSSPEDEADYEGEDWGWFVNDVTTHMQDNYSDIFFDSVYRSWFDENDIAQLKKELDLDGFGYVCINKKGEKLFISHDMPSGVISSMTEFFGYEPVDEQ